MTLKALIFDLDGTLADTDPTHFRAFARVLEAHGMSIDAEFYRDNISGCSNQEICARLFPHGSTDEHARFASAKEAAFRDLATELVPTQGLQDLLAWARRGHLPLALVTNAPRENVDHMLRALNLEAAFDAIILGEELERAKPDSLPYRTALRLLGIAPGDAVAFEDSAPGVASAKGAGITTVGVTTSQSAANLVAAGADHTIADFSDGKLADVLRAATFRDG